MSNYYDRQGNRMGLMEWAKSFEGERHIGNTTLPNGLRVSTVWLGLDHSFVPGGPPLIFETMVFPKDSMGELDCERYSTEDEAKAGHARLVEKWTAEPVEA